MYSRVISSMYSVSEHVFKQLTYIVRDVPSNLEVFNISATV